MKTRNILDLYVTMKKGQIYSELNKLKEDILLSDEYIQRLTNSFKKIEEVFKEVGNSDYRYLRKVKSKLTKSLDNSIFKENYMKSREYENKLVGLTEFNKFISEIETTMLACATYDEEIEVLKAHNILDKHCKLNYK